MLLCCCPLLLRVPACLPGYLHIKVLKMIPWFFNPNCCAPDCSSPAPSRLQSVPAQVLHLISLLGSPIYCRTSHQRMLVCSFQSPVNSAPVCIQSPALCVASISWTAICGFIISCLSLDYSMSAPGIVYLWFFCSFICYSRALDIIHRNWFILVWMVV